MKPFHVWESEMAGTIEDHSVIRKSEIKNYSTQLTALQTRAAIADLLVPNPTSSGEIEDWLTVFAVNLTYATVGDRELVPAFLPKLIGIKFDNELRCNSLESYLSLREAIKNGLGV